MYTETEINMANMLLYGAAAYFNYKVHEGGSKEFRFSVKNKLLGEFIVSYKQNLSSDSCPIIRLNDSELYNLTSRRLIEIGHSDSESDYPAVKLYWNKAIKNIMDDVIIYGEGQYSTFLELMLLIIKYCPDLENGYFLGDNLFGNIYINKGKISIDSSDKVALNFIHGTDLAQSLLELPIWSLEKLVLIQGFSDNQELRYRNILNLSKEIVYTIENLKDEDI